MSEHDSPLTARSIFDHALSIGGPADRQAYLTQACGDDDEIRRKVDALLAAYVAAGSFLEAPARDLGLGLTQDQPALPLREGPGSVIGPYKLLQQIGEGGMGVVFLAEQARPVRRQVALKVIKAGMDTRQVVARFEAERQALAMMDHVNIARVLDAGATDAGRPYFVMELVKGVPITRYCDEHRLTPRHRLELFVQVCAAVQHAHTKGIIHRDLKPSNVLIALYDGKPVPKVIDFGVAKATGGRLTEATVFTGFGAIIGTPEYMSPEQAELNQLDIDTRSDVYSLGVILYELLTGTTPLERKKLDAAALLEVLRVVREQDPPRPSTRLSTTDQLASIAASRGLEPRKLGVVVRGELDWIVMRALEKDRNRRYETANGFAMDVQRYLDDEAVLACPPSAVYRMRKFVRRNRAAVLTATAVLFVLLAGISGTTFGLIQAEQRRAEADQARGNEAAQRQIADAQKKKAEQAEADMLADYRASTDDAIEELIGSKPSLGPQERAYLETTLKRWQAFAARRGDDERSQAIRAEGHHRVAVLWEKLGDRDKARREYETARDLWQKLTAAFPADPKYRYPLAAIHHNLGRLLIELGQRDAARREIETALDLGQKLVAAFPDEPGHQGALAAAYNSLGTLLEGMGQFEKAGTEYETARDLYGKLVARFPKVPQYQWDEAQRRASVAATLTKLGQHDAARTQFEKSRDAIGKLAAAFPDIIEYQEGLARIHINMGWFLAHTGQAEAARTEYEKARDLFKKLVAAFPAVPRFQSRLADSHNNLGTVLNKLEQRGAAVKEYEAALDLQKKLAAAFPAEHEYQLALGGACCNYGSVINDEGRPADSLQWFDLAVRTLTPLYEQDRRAVQVKEFLFNSHSRRAIAYDRLGKYAEAIKDWDKAIELHPKHALPHYGRGGALLNQKMLDQAVIAFRKAIDIDPKYADAHRGLGHAFYEQKKLNDAVAAFRKASELEPESHFAHIELAGVLKAQGKLDEAIDECREAVRLKPELASVREQLASALNGLAWSLATHPESDKRDPGRAITLAKEAIELAPKAADSWNTLGVAHYRNGDWKNAIESLQKHRELRTNDAEWNNPFFLAMAHQQLGNKEEAAQWYSRGVDWMEREKARSDTMLRSRAEAAALLGIEIKP